ncbi:MAG: efflux RND transporter periplasmic adaptor subunit [Chthoniobacterales bacterium]
MTTTTLNKAGVAPSEHRRGRKGVYLAGGSILLLVAIFVWRGIGGETTEKLPRPPRVVEVATVIQKDVPLYLNGIGNTTAYETVNLQAQVTGQIVAREFEDGADVKKGDLLFKIDPRPYEAVLASAKADFALAQSNLKRQTDLAAKNVTATQELDTARANAMRTEAAVAAAQVNLDFCAIRAPIDGRAGLRRVDVGNVVSPAAGAVLLTIQGMDPIYTDFTIAEPDLPLVRRYLGGPTLKVLTDAEDDSIPPRAGELSFVDQAVQQGAGTIKARATTPNPDRALWPSQFVRVRLILDQLQGAKLVPTSAVQIGQNGPYLFVVKPDSTLDLRQVKPGQTQDGDLTVIDKGVEAGERVVVSGQLQLAPGATVSVKEHVLPTPAGERSGTAGAH